MPETLDPEETTLTHRVVLAGLAAVADDEGAPAHAGEVRRTCADRLGDVDGDVVGTLTEAEVSRALNELEARGLLAATRDDTSATGKGRPRYDLGVDREPLLADLREDDRVRPLVDDLGA